MLHSKILPETEALEFLREVLTSSENEPVAVDVETNGKDCRDGRGFAHGVSIAFRNSTGGVSAAYFPFRHTVLGTSGNYNLRTFLPLLQQLLDRYPIIYHNAKGDLVFLSTLGLKTRRTRFICSMVMAHLVDENQPRSKSLDSCAKYYLGDSKQNPAWHAACVKNPELWAYVTPDLICGYAMYDAYLALKLWGKLKPLAAKENLQATWQHKKDFTECLIEIEGNGIQIDTELCERMTELGEKEMQEQVNKLGGLNPGSRNDLEELLIRQLELPYMYNTDKKTKEQKVTFDKDAMEKYEELLERTNNTTAQTILTYRGWQKSVSSNYKPYTTLLSPDGRLRPNYKMHGTKTGRLSCENPNLQQIPKAGVKPWNGKMKQCFVPATDFALIGFDYSQLELRVGTAYAEDEALIQVFQEGKDIFQMMSDNFIKMGLKEMNRDRTKTFVYSTQYGGGVNRISNVFNISRERAAEIRSAYYASYPGFRAATQQASSMALRDKRIRLWSGRYRHFQYPTEESFKAFNSVIQGGSADIVERAMLRLWKLNFPKDECRMLLQIHDEIIFEIRKGLENKYKPIIMDVMTQVDYHPSFQKVKFAADCKEWGKK